MRTSAFAMLLALACSGCSAVVHGPMQDVRIESNPPGANVTLFPQQSQRGVIFGRIWNWDAAVKGHKHRRVRRRLGSEVRLVIASGNHFMLPHDFGFSGRCVNAGA